MVAPAIKKFRHRESCESDESFGRKRPNFPSSSILGLQDSLDSPDSRCLPLRLQYYSSFVWWTVPWDLVVASGCNDRMKSSTIRVNWISKNDFKKRRLNSGKPSWTHPCQPMSWNRHATKSTSLKSKEPNF
jgi:hypothetical protein